MEIYADMVKIHYEYFKNKDKYKKHIPSNLKEITKYSDKDSMVFENNDEIVIAMRGLQVGRSFDDVVIGTEIFFEDAYQQSGSDFDTSTQKKKGISLLPNKYGEILLKEQSKIDELKKEYPNKKIVLSGHSRGGRKAIDLGEKNQLEYHAFQPAEMNRPANPLLSMGTNVMMGGFSPPNIPILREIPSLDGMVSTSKIEGEMWKSLYGTSRLTNNLMFEFGSPMKLQKNVVGSAVQSEGYQSFANKFATKTMTPTVIERSIGMVGGENPLYEPVDFTRMPSNTFNTQSLNMIEPVVSAVTGSKPEKRKTPTESISNIYKTSNDLVSKGYQHTELVQPKQYAYNWWDHYLLGDHSIDHFVSKGMFDSVNENIQIEEIEDVKSDSLEDNFSPPSDITPSSSLGYTVDNVSLCRKYPNYSPHCKKILR